MKKTILISLLILCCISVKSQIEILDEKKHTLPRFTGQNLCTTIGGNGLLTITQLDKKPNKFIVTAGEGFRVANTVPIDADKGFKKLGTLNTFENSYLYLIDKNRYMQIGANQDYEIEVKTNSFPENFIPKSIEKYGELGILYNEKSLMILNPKNGEHEIINILPEIIQTTDLISKVQTFEGSNEVVIYFVAQIGMRFKALQSLVRYNIETMDSQTMDVSNIAYFLEGEALITEDKTYFTGSEISKSKGISAFHFLIFEGSKNISSSRIELDSIFNKHPLTHHSSTGKIYIKRGRRAFANTYKPILLQDGGFLVYRDLFKEREEVPTYSNSLENNMYRYGFENDRSYVSKYQQNGQLVWTEEIFHMSNRVGIDYENMNYIKLLSDNSALAIQPSYTGIGTSLIDIEDGKVTNNFSRVPPVNSTAEELKTWINIAAVSKKILPLAENKYVFYGYSVTVPIGKKSPVHKNYSFQLLELEIEE